MTEELLWKAMKKLCEAKMELDRASQEEPCAMALSMEVFQLIAKIEKIYYFAKSKRDEKLA